MDVEQIRKVGRSLPRFLDEFSDCFGRCDTRAYLKVYVKGQLSDLQRKSAEPMGERPGATAGSAHARGGGASVESRNRAGSDRT